MHLLLSDRRFDLTRRALVMGVLNRTRDSFYDGGAYYRLDDLLRRAEELVRDGADLLDVGARPGGVGVREVGEAEETDLVTSTVEALHLRFDAPLSVDTRRASVAAAAFETGAVLGNDMSGFADPDYLPVAAAAGAAVVATHIRLPPGVPDPDPRYQDVVADVREALRKLAARAMATGIPGESILLDPGLDLGKTWQQSLTLLASTGDFAALGHPLLAAPSHKIFLGRLLGRPLKERGDATVAACALAVAAGAGVVRVHDVRGARDAVDLATALRPQQGTQQ
jgi:dihydropteroate synthase